MMEIAGKTAFVTGAASGIGLGIATALSQAGVKVMLCDIEDAALVKAVADLKLTNADVDGVRADVSLKAELQAAADATIARYGKVHILVNNAGVGGGGSYGRWTDASWNWTLGVNLMSVVWGVEIFGPLIEAHGEGGQIVSTAFPIVVFRQDRFESGLAWLMCSSHWVAPSLDITNCTALAFSLCRSDSSIGPPSRGGKKTAPHHFISLSSVIGKPRTRLPVA